MQQVGSVLNQSAMKLLSIVFIPLLGLLLVQVHFCKGLEVPEDFDIIRDNPLVVFRSPATWADSKEICKKHGMQLYTFDKYGDNAEMVKFGLNNGLEEIWNVDVSECMSTNLKRLRRRWPGCSTKLPFICENKVELSAWDEFWSGGKKRRP